MDVIATRQLHDLESNTALTVSIGRPIQRDEAEWMCEFDLSCADFAKQGQIYGADGIQALQLCLEAIREELLRLGKRYSWNDLAVELAFPQTLPIVLGDAFYRKLSLLIEQEVHKFVSNAENP
jgi:hypothetical protein